MTLDLFPHIVLDRALDQLLKGALDRCPDDAARDACHEWCKSTKEMFRKDAKVMQWLRDGYPFGLEYVVEHFLNALSEQYYEVMKERENAH